MNRIKKKISQAIDGIMWLFGVGATPPKPAEVQKDDEWMDRLMRRTLAERVWYDHGEEDHKGRGHVD